MTGAAKRAMFGVSLVLGLMLGLEAHIDRGSPVSEYSSYLEATETLSESLNQSAALARKLEHDQAQVQALLRATNHTASGMQSLQGELNALDREAGLTELSGPGLSLTIDYDPNLPVIPGLRYVDEATQLQMVVNILLASGAKGIAINDQRLVTTSGIRSVETESSPGPFAGAVQINSEPVVAPYVIYAVGNATNMLSVLHAEGIADQFAILDQSFVIKEYTSSSPMKIPAYSGPLPGLYAMEVPL